MASHAASPAVQSSREKSEDGARPACQRQPVAGILHRGVSEGLLRRDGGAEGDGGGQAAEHAQRCRERRRGRLDWKSGKLRD